VTRGRDVVPQMPTVAAGEVAGSTAPLRVSIATGTSIAIELTAYPATVSGAKFIFAVSWLGVSTPDATLDRRLSVSKAAPRSIQNASSVVPANTLMPLSSE